MFKDLDLARLRRMPEIAHCFRYPLHHSDFQEIRAEGRLLGRYAAEPLYGRLTPTGAVDQSAGYNGQVAVIFLPARIRSIRSARLLLTRMARKRVTLPDGRRNWPAHDHWLRLSRPVFDDDPVAVFDARTRAKLLEWAHLGLAPRCCRRMDKA